MNLLTKPRLLALLLSLSVPTPQLYSQNFLTAPPLSITWVRTNPAVNGECQFTALNQFNYTTGQYWGCLPLDNPSARGFNVGGWKPIPAPEVVGYGAALPTFCTIGRIFYLTTATAGLNVYGCTALNTWTLEGGGSGTPIGPAGGDLSGTYPNPNVANGSHITNSSVPNSGLAHPSVTVSGQTCTLGSTCTVPIPPPAFAHSPNVTFDGGGVALTTGAKAYTTVPYGCTIEAWDMTVDTGTASVDVWKIASGTAIPTVANTITASALPAIASGTARHSTTLTAWTTAVTANDIFGFNLSAVSGATKVNLVLQCQEDLAPACN